MYEKPTYTVYILHCHDSSYYTGMTNDLSRRLIEHQEGIDRFCYTYPRRPVDLVYACHFENVFEAIHWEKTLKKWSRKKKEAVIRRDFEVLPDLSRNRTEYPLEETLSREHPSTGSG